MIQNSFVWMRLRELVESGSILARPYRVTHEAWRAYPNIVVRSPGGPTTVMFKNLTAARGKHWLVPWTEELRALGLLAPHNRLAATIFNHKDAERVTLLVGTRTDLDLIRAGWEWRGGFWEPPDAMEVARMLLGRLRNR